MNRSRKALLAALVGCTLLLGGVAAAFVLGHASDALPGLGEARARWAARPFARYQMHVRDICEQDVTVQGDRVVDYSSTICGLRGRTIDELFALIERDQTVTYTCVSGGCTCDDVMSVTASYDPALGYPTAIEVRIVARPNPTHPDFWRQVWATWRMPHCRLVEGAKTIRVTTFKPL